MDNLLPAVLTESERQELAQHEQVIKAGLQTFYDVGNALAAIRDAKLYREDYETFEDYCRERWQISRPRAYQMISSAEVVDNVSTMVDILPTSERQVRPLTKLPPDDQRTAWAEAVATAPDGKVTGAHVEQIVERMQADDPPSFVWGPVPGTRLAADDEYPDASILPLVSGDGRLEMMVDGVWTEMEQAHVGFPSTCPDGRRVCVHDECLHWRELDDERELCAEPSFQSTMYAARVPSGFVGLYANVTHCLYCGEPLNDTARSAGWRYCNGDECHRKFDDIDDIDDTPDLGIESPPSPLDNIAPLMTSNSVEWYTPPEIVAQVVALMGGIDLDPCSNEGEPNIPANHHFTKVEDGLIYPWFGRVYMNPPYGREIEQWIDKLLSEYECGNVGMAIALVPARTDTAWWRKLRDFPVVFVRGRLKFSGADNSATFPSALVALGFSADEAMDAFEDIGDVWVRWQG